MRCYVYKSRIRPDTYIYLAKEDDFEVLPEGLRQSLGDLESVLVFELNAERRLARVDTSAVLAALHSSGYFLQLPPTLPNGSELRG